MPARPYRVTVTFIRTGEPEIIMQESFTVTHHYTPEELASAVAEYTIDTWMRAGDVEVISANYWYTTVKEEEMSSGSHYSGTHRR